MRNKLRVGSLVLSLISSLAFADPIVPVTAYVEGYIAPGGAQAKACNTGYSVPIQCAVQVRGFYANGLYTYSVANLILVPGACDFAFVAAGYFPFSYADAAAQCAFVP
jgi:hypothetical protein